MNDNITCGNCGTDELNEQDFETCGGCTTEFCYNCEEIKVCKKCESDICPYCCDAEDENLCATCYL